MGHFRRSWRMVISILIAIGIIMAGSVVVMVLARPYFGMVYSCGLKVSQCTYAPASNARVYLLSSWVQQSTPNPVVLQETNIDVTGHYWFWGAPLGAVAAVYIGRFRPHTWMGPHAALPYCTFAAQWKLSHDINMGSSDLATFIADFGGEPPDLVGCPDSITERLSDQP